jgi:Tol biopolymer transport system component
VILRLLFAFTLSFFIICTLLMFVAKSIVAPLIPRNPMLAYVSERDGFFTVNVYDFSRRLRSSIAPTNQFTTLAWSPDGQLAFISLANFRIGLTIWDGDSFTEIAPDLVVVAQTLTWSADGRLAFAASSRDATRFIYVWENGLLVQASSSPTFNYDPQWSADGRLAFVSRSTNEEIYVWDNGALNNISRNAGAADTSPRWSADGRLAFISTRDDARGDIYVWDGTSITNISHSPNVISSDPAWSADGRLAFVSDTNTNNGEIMFWDGTNLTSIALPNTVNTHYARPVWNVDGRLAFQAASYAPELYVWDNGLFTFVSTIMSASPNAVRWSADGRLIFMALNGSDTDIASWHSGTVTNLTSTPDIDEFAPAMWTP